MRVDKEYNSISKSLAFLLGFHMITLGWFGYALGVFLT